MLYQCTSKNIMLLPWYKANKTRYYRGTGMVVHWEAALRNIGHQERLFTSFLSLNC